MEVFIEKIKSFNALPHYAIAMRLKRRDHNLRAEKEGPQPQSKRG